MGLAAGKRIEGSSGVFDKFHGEFRRGSSIFLLWFFLGFALDCSKCESPRRKSFDLRQCMKT